MIRPATALDAQVIADLWNPWIVGTAKAHAAVALHARLTYRKVARIPDAGSKFGRFMDILQMQKILS